MATTSLDRIAALALIALAASTTALAPAAQVAQPAPTAGEPVRAERVCGLGKEFHAGRRKELCARLKAGAVVVRGLPEPRDYTPFRQDKAFWYLTGVESPGAALLLDAKSGREILFLPRPDRMKESWDGEMWDSKDEWVKELTGFAEVKPVDQLEEELVKLIAPVDGPDKKKVWLSLAPHVELAGAFDRAGPYDRRQAKDPLDGRPSREQALEKNLREKFGALTEDLSAELNEIRRVKTAEEIQAIRRASQIGARAMEEAIRSTRPGLGEWELDAAMTFVHRREGADGPAYLAIVGSGPNSCVLHYGASTRVMKSGEMLLIDYAPEFAHYTSDITRTWPVDGTFTPRMQELYDAVLAAQAAGIATVKPGFRIRDVEQACSKVLRERGFKDLVRHGACHYVGMEVHDVGDYDRPFEPGVVFTIEPGLYDEKAAIGIRIEDVVVVTADGCEVLSAGVAKERAAVEALVGQAGLLERVESR